MERVESTCKFMGLPSDLIRNILGRWLDRKSVSRLDCALCSSMPRSVLMDTFALKPFCTNDCEYIGSVGFLHWLLARKIVLPDIQLIDSFPGLSEYLRLCAPSIRCIQCNDSSALDTVATHCRDLTSLSVCQTVVTESINAILRVNSNLVELHIMCLNEDEVLYTMEPQNLFLLKLLNLFCSSTNDATLINLVAGAGSLLQVELASCEAITDAGALAVINNCPLLRTFGAADVQLSDSTLVSLSKSCPNLMHLDLAGNALLTDDTVLSIAKNLKALRSINLSRCTLTDQSVQCLSQYSASTLQLLDMRDIPTVCVEVLQQLLERCTQLTYLAIDCDFNDYIVDIVPHMCNLETLVTDAVISDDALCMIATHCTRLKTLSILSQRCVPEHQTDHMVAGVMYCADEALEWGARLYTSKGLIALMDGLVHLQRLSVRREESWGNGILNEFAQAAWQRLRPQLKITHFGLPYDVLKHSIL